MGKCFSKKNIDLESKQKPADDFEKSIIASHQNIFDIYDIQQNILGNGQTGFVHTASLKTNKDYIVAIKTIIKEKFKTGEKLFKHEINIMKNLDHPNLLKFLELYEDDKFYHVVTDLCTGGELQKKLESQNFSECDMGSVFKQILECVNYLHHKQICHRDLKPQNIMFLNDEPNSIIKIIDYGYSFNFMIKKEDLNEVLGTPYYMAPELFSGKYNEKCDLWSIGVMMYYSICLNYPFNGKNREQLQKQILNRELCFIEEIWEDIDDDIKDLIRKLLDKNPNTRYSAKQALEHDWFVVQKRKHRQSGDIPIELQNAILYTQMQKNATKIMTSFLSYREIHDLNKMFRQIDIHQQGFIEYKDFQKALVSIQNEEAKAKFQGVFDNLKSLKKDKINYSEFIELALDHKKYFTEINLKKVFDVYDIDKKNKITLENLEEIMQRQGMDQNQEDTQQWMDQFDIEKKGYIDFQQFFQVMNQDLK